MVATSYEGEGSPITADRSAGCRARKAPTIDGTPAALAFGDRVLMDALKFSWHPK